MQNRILLMVGILLILLGLLQGALRRPEPYARSTVLSEAVPVVPEAFVQNAPTAAPVQQPTCTCALAVATSTIETATKETATALSTATVAPTESATIAPELLVVETAAPRPTATRTIIRAATATRQVIATSTRAAQATNTVALVPTNTTAAQIAAPTSAGTATGVAQIAVASPTQTVAPDRTATRTIIIPITATSKRPTATAVATTTATTQATVTVTVPRTVTVTITRSAIVVAIASPRATRTIAAPTASPTVGRRTPTPIPTATQPRSATSTATIQPTATSTATPTNTSIPTQIPTITPDPSITALAIAHDEPGLGPGLFWVGAGQSGQMPRTSMNQPQQQPSNAKVRVITEAPTNMGENVSLPITVSVIPADSAAASIRDALKEYGVTAINVVVDGPGFSISPAEPQESQWLNEEMVQWTWVAASKSPGLQTIRVSLTARGKPDWSSDPVEGPIWSGTVQVNVEQSSGFDLSKIDIFAPVNTLAGLGLTCPWLFDQIKKRRGKKRAET